MCRVDGKKVEVQAAMPAAAAISTFYVYYIPLNGFYFMWSTAHFLFVIYVYRSVDDKWNVNTSMVIMFVSRDL